MKQILTNLSLIVVSYNIWVQCMYVNVICWSYHKMPILIDWGTDHLTWWWGLWFFVSFRIFFPDNTELEYLFFCCAQREFFPQNLTLGYMTKTLNQIFFFLHQNQNIFFSNIGNQNIFLEKNHNPPI